MAKLDPIPLRGGSGRAYEFRVYVWGHRFKPLPAVYAAMERRLEPDGTARYLPVYVGETADLSRIFENHPRDECLQVYLTNTIAVFPEADARNRKTIVADLLAVLEPPCNEIGNIDSLELD